MSVRVHNAVRIAALVCVAATSAFIMWMAYRVNETLSGAGWCRTALGADKATSADGTIKGLDACVSLLTIQLKSLSTNSHILFGVIALCLLVLIVIVIAGARLAGEGFGGKLSINPATDPAAAAQATASAAQETADQITEAQ